MQSRLETIIDCMTQASSLDDLQEEILKLRNLFEVEHLVYHSVSNSGEQYAVLTYRPEWVSHYIASKYERIDPVVLGCYKRFHPVDWKRLDWKPKAARAFLGEAIENGVGRQGFSVPIRGPQGQFALFTVNHNCDDESWERHTGEFVRDMILAAHYINQKALELEGAVADAPVRPMSPRETDVLTLLALGYSRAQAADSLSISEHTLRAYLESARNKLGALNTTHAVARALTQGLLVL